MYYLLLTIFFFFFSLNKYIYILNKCCEFQNWAYTNKLSSFSTCYFQYFRSGRENLVVSILTIETEISESNELGTRIKWPKILP
jgi:hypothetical protein